MRPMRHRPAMLALAVSLASLLALGVAVAAPSARGTLARTPQAPVALPKAHPDVRGLDPALAALDEAAETSGAAGAKALARGRGIKLAGDRVTVAVESVGVDVARTRKAIAAVGGTVTAEADTLLRADVPAGRLRALAGADGVLRVRQPRRPYDLAVTEGVHMAAADQWQAKGRGGAGVKIGIIDAGFYGYERMAAPDFPQGSHLTTAAFGASFASYSGGSHGTAVTEIVHDMAPDAEYYLVAIGDDLDLKTAEAWLAANHVQVVNMSLGFIGPPLDGGRTGDTTINRAVTKAVTVDGMFWANASGNFRMSHWGGNFSRSSYVAPTQTNPNFAFLELDWNGRRSPLNLFVGNGDEIEGELWWKDSWTAAINDYDLLLYHGVWSDSSHTRISRFDLVRGYEGDARQWGRTGDQPYEEVRYPSSVPGDIYAWVVVDQRPWAGVPEGYTRSLPANNAAVDFDFFCPNQDLDIYRGARSIMTPADNESKGFMAVGAICAQWTPEPLYEQFPPARPGFAQQETYSSEGPNARGVNTVDIAAADDVTSDVPDFWPTFRGTSASSPHVAGGAALALAASYPATLTPAQLETYLRGNAVDLMTPGADTKTGSGALRLPPLDPPALQLDRVAGTDRYKTALAMSAAWPSGSATDVVLASGANWPDALAGSSLAGALDSPILLTPPDSIPASVTAELRRLTSGAATPTVHVLGGAVSPQIVVKLKGEGFRVVRLAGKDRYETAVKIANAALGLRWRGMAFVVTGKNFADALSVAPYAYSIGIPVIPVGSALTSETEAFFRSGLVHNAVIVGGVGGVTAAQVAAIANCGVTVDGRWSGSDRYATMKSVVEHANSLGWLDYSHIAIASGQNFPDAIAGAPFIAREGGGLLLTKPNILVRQAADIVSANKTSLSDVRLLGGKPSVQGAVWLGVRDLTD